MSVRLKLFVFGSCFRTLTVILFQIFDCNKQKEPSNQPQTQTPSTGLRHPSFNRKVPESDARSAPQTPTPNPTPTSFLLRPPHPIPPLGKLLSFHLEEGAGKRISECASNPNSKQWFTTSFLQCDARSAQPPPPPLLLPPSTHPHLIQPLGKLLVREKRLLAHQQPASTVGKS